MPYADPDKQRAWQAAWTRERRKDPGIAEQHRAEERERYRTDPALRDRRRQQMTARRAQIRAEAAEAEGIERRRQDADRRRREAEQRRKDADDGPLGWQTDALCAQTDPELFFPEGKGFVAREAKAVCASCDVQAQCLAYALQNDERFGIWGGTSPKERQRLKRLARHGDHATAAHDDSAAEAM